jgi:CelD/BcsL family acetyltransferase involved in cellulose biosynthesis
VTGPTVLAPEPQLAALKGELIESVEELEGHWAGWDALAEACGRPYCAPAWMLAWWRHLRPPGASLRVAVVRAGELVLGVAPYFVQRGPAGLIEYRLLASGAATRLGPLALPGYEEPVARAFAQVFAEARPRPRAIRLEGTDARSPWPDLMSRFWSARPSPIVRCYEVQPAPVVALEGLSYEEWLESRSANFRQQMRRMRRKAIARGGRLRMTASPAELERDLAAFCRLHHGRWAGRGGSAALSEGRERMLYEAGERLLGEDRFRVWVLELGGEAISVNIFVTAGAEVCYYLGGFDERWAELKPSMLTIVEALEDSFRRDDRRFDLGPSAPPYKLRLADGDDPLAWLVVYPRDLRHPIVTTQGMMCRGLFGLRTLAQHLPPQTRRRLKRLVKRRS